MGHTSITLASWSELLQLTKTHDSTDTAIDGASLTLARITGVARYKKRSFIPSQCLDQVKRSVDEVEARLRTGSTIYAVNTGVGASANTRTTAVDLLQQNIIRTLNCGILDHTHHEGRRHNGTDAPQHSESVDSLPAAWVRAANLVRINSLAQGKSGVRPEVLQNLHHLLQEDIIPCISLRGSISASGDLSPLSYIAGAIQGNPGIQVWTHQGESRTLTTADKALRQAGIKPITYAPKEALAIVNGTSVSAGAAALAMHDAHGCVALAQILTAMNVEGLNGTIESFDSYFSAVRPHPGQREAARNIRNFLNGSKLARKANTENSNGLLQDRYALRTASQWIGPELENMTLAHNQIVTECNSVTDNPLVREDGTVLQGGNFQACAVTSAMDKVRSTLQHVGRMVFQQTSELMNPNMNNGLPPNLTADDPSCDFLFKGMDIASASYQSELAFLAHGITPFVMSAEQGNQSINSMALVSARYTHTALEIFMQLTANCLLAACQALDLRAVQFHFEQSLEPRFMQTLATLLEGSLIDSRTERGMEKSGSKPVSAKLWNSWKREFYLKSSLDIPDRVESAMTATIMAILTSNTSEDESIETVISLADLRMWSQDIQAEAIELYKITVQQHTPAHTLPLLGTASRRVYKFIRQDLDVPFLRSGSPGPQNLHTFYGTEPGTTVGTFTSRLYRTIRDGKMMVPVTQCLKEAMEEDKLENEGVNGSKTLCGSQALVRRASKKRRHSVVEGRSGREELIKCKRCRA